MALFLLIALGVLWFFGLLPNNFFDIPLFELAGRTITVYNLVILTLIITIIGILPRPFREIAVILLILWLLSILGVIMLAGFSNIIVAAIIVGLILFLLGGR